MSQLNGFLPSWTDPTCLFKSLFWAKLLPHMLHLKGSFLSSTDWMHSYKFCFLLKIESHLPCFSIEQFGNSFSLIWRSWNVCSQTSVAFLTFIFYHTFYQIAKSNFCKINHSVWFLLSFDMEWKYRLIHDFVINWW